MPLICPACEGELAPVDTAGHYGTRMVVTSCRQCLGFWLEAIEVVGIGHDAVTELEGDADLGRVCTTPRSDFRACPKCRTALAEVTGGLAPEGLQVDTCPSCNGMWFDRGELLVYKSALEQRRKTQNTTDLSERHKRTRGAARQHNSRYGGTAIRSAADALALLL